MISIELVAWLNVLQKNKKTGAKTNISNFGFGVSQSIPIFIQGARMAPYTTLMVEQRKHRYILQPSWSWEVSLLIYGKNFQVGSVIETHSDNILLRLRHLIAKKELETGDVSIVFFDNKNNKAVIKNLEIKQDGSLEEGLPMEFFHKIYGSYGVGSKYMNKFPSDCIAIDTNVFGHLTNKLKNADKHINDLLIYFMNQKTSLLVDENGNILKEYNRHLNRPEFRERFEGKNEAYILYYWMHPDTRKKSYCYE